MVGLRSQSCGVQVERKLKRAASGAALAPPPNSTPPPLPEPRPARRPRPAWEEDPVVSDHEGIVEVAARLIQVAEQLEGLNVTRRARGHAERHGHAHRRCPGGAGEAAPRRGERRTRPALPHAAQRAGARLSFYRRTAQAPPLACAAGGSLLTSRVQPELHRIAIFLHPAVGQDVLAGGTLARPSVPPHHDEPLPRPRWPPGWRGRCFAVVSIHFHNKTLTEADMTP